MKTYEQIDAAIKERREDVAFMARLAEIHARERALFEHWKKR